MDKHILLISYTFPPYPGIGGRRWTKFAKYLSRLGYTIHVIHSKNPFNEQSLWIDDVKNNLNILTYELNELYPKELLIQPKTFIEKCKYRLSLFIIKLFTKGTPYDKSVFWRRSMLKTSQELIKKHNIKNVIVSCAPFNSAYYALDLKRNNKNLNLIVDFRDPWTWGVNYGFLNLTHRRLLFEKQKEKEVIEYFDYIFVPSVEMKNHIESSFSITLNKVVEIPHAFDSDEISVKPKPNSDTIRLIFYGTLYNDLNTVFENISEAILKTESKMILDIYSSSNSYENIFKQKGLLGNKVNYYKPLSPKNLFNSINSYDYVLIVQPDYAKDYITTKIYEIIYSETPIVLISNNGKLSDFIKNNGLGYAFTPHNLVDNFKIIFNGDSHKFQQFPINNYSFNFITTKITNYFK